jgi:hypothetical protein
MNLPEKKAEEIMSKISDEYPNWRLKVKEDGPEYQTRPEKFPRQQQNYPQQQFQQQMPMYPYPPSQMQPTLIQPPSHQPIQNRGHHQMPSQPMHHMQHQGQHQSHIQYQPRNPMPNYNFSQQPQNDKG